jgi:dienelactone hydrolase
MRLLFLILSAATLLAQTTEPPRYQPTAEEKLQIRTKMKPLADVHDPDVAIYYKAADWILRHEEEFYTKAYYTSTLVDLDAGLLRMEQLRRGETPWNTQRGRVPRAYISRVDGSLQPYIITVPENYDPAKPIRLDVVLHGRAATMNEVSFLAPKKQAQPGYPWLVLEVFGRTNNAYRWGGETDVFEAIDSVRSHYNVDPKRIVLRGFSMGGAGAWHIGLHYPDKWAAIEAGAGFTETLKYAKLKNVPAYQLPTMHIYDSVDYALNVSDVPTVGYGGEIDPQLRASQSIQEQLKGIPGLEALFLVGPNTAHKFHPDSKRASDEFLDKAAERGQHKPEHLRFVTYTTRYNECDGITIDELTKQYERAEVEQEGSNLRTSNIARLTLTDTSVTSIDGQRIKPGQVVTLEKRSGGWQPVSAKRPVSKTHGLQGPIDDAFMDAFLCVNPPIQFIAEYDKWMRADLPRKPAEQVSKEDIKNKNLILFGDASNNKLIDRIASRLPVQWTKEHIVIAGQEYPAAEYSLTLICPNPLNPTRYVVVNSGYTFHEKDFKGTNALLYPHLPDWAVIRKSDGAVAQAGFFDSNWH